MSGKISTNGSPGGSPDLEKELAHKEYIHDKDILGPNNISHAATYEALHFSSLSEEELEDEKKLRRKIDFVIMPLVVLIYLMNYIGAYSSLCGDGHNELRTHPGT